MTHLSPAPAPASAFDLSAIRAQFPALAGDRPPVHADAPAGTQVHAAVLEAMTDYLVKDNANTRGVFPTSHRTDAMVASVRVKAASFTGGEADGIVFGPNMTTLTWHLSRALERRLSPGDEIVCTRLDHDANVTPWRVLADRTGAEIRWVDLDAATGRLRTDAIPVGPRTKLVAFPVASNALGTAVDPSLFVEAARSVGALTFCDAVHSAPHLPMDRHGWGVDIVACSPYKFFGPHSGLLSADPALLAELTPDKVRPAPDEGPERWQTGTASFEAIAGIGAAIDYVTSIGMGAIGAHEQTLTRRFLEGVATLPHVSLHGPDSPDDRTPTFAVTARGHDPRAVSEALARRGVFTWSGHYYAVEPMRALGLLDRGGAVRIGFVHYHGVEDVDRVLDALAALP